MHIKLRILISCILLCISGNLFCPYTLKQTDSSFTNNTQQNVTLDVITTSYCPSQVNPSEKIPMTGSIPIKVKAMKTVKFFVGSKKRKIENVGECNRVVTLQVRQNNTILLKQKIDHPGMYHFSSDTQENYVLDEVMA